MEPDRRRKAAWHLAAEICEQERMMSIRLAKHAQTIIEALYLKLGRPLNILTHCNAGSCDRGTRTATAGIYTAFEAGIPLTVYADETRPRLQGTLTAWELKAAGIPVCLIADNAGGELMREGGIDLVIVGADRIAANGDTANKIGTYLKALAAADNQIPFYVAAPISTSTGRQRAEEIFRLKTAPVTKYAGCEVLINTDRRRKSVSPIPASQP